MEREGIVLDFKLNEALSGPGTKHWGVGFPKEFALPGDFFSHLNNAGESDASDIKV